MSGDLLIRGGWIVTVDPALGELRGDVLVRAGRIAQVGSVDPAQAVGAEVIDATGAIVLPGFVDTHRHTWQSALRHRNGDRHGGAYFAELLDRIGPDFTPDDVYVGTLLGALSAIDAGTTTMFDWAHIQNTPAHADAGIRALKESGMRAVFGHGRTVADPQDRVAQRGRPHSADLRRIQREHFAEPSLVTLAMAARGPEAADDWRGDLDLARELGLYSSIHVGMFDLGPRFRAIEQMRDAGMLGPDLVFIHANSCSAEEVAAIAEAGAGLSIGPQVEMLSQGGGDLVTDKFLAAGVWPSLSGDTETLGSGDLFTQMRHVLADYRSRAGAGRIAPGAPETLTTADVLRMATTVGSQTLGMGELTGSITPGKAADLVLVDGSAVNLVPVGDPVGATVLAAHPGNVDTVIVDGRVLKRGGELVAVDLDRVRRLAVESHRRHPPRPA